MAWIVLVESAESLSLYKSGSGQSPTVRTIDTLKASCSITCDSELSKMRQSGMTYVPSKHLICPWCQILSTEVFPAKILVLQEMAKAWFKAIEANYSLKSSALLKKFDPLSSFLKTCLRLGRVDLTLFSANSPAYGMIVGGRLFLPQSLEPVILEKDGSYLPTIGANEFKGSGRERFKGSPHFRGAKMSEGLRHRCEDPIYTHPNFAELAMGYSIDHTALGDLETQWFHAKPKKHLKG